MTPADLAIMGSGYALFFTFGLVWGLTLFRKEKVKRARTCGTCKYCTGSDTMMVSVAFCQRHAPLKRDSTTQIDMSWKGCGESEEG